MPHLGLILPDPQRHAVGGALTLEGQRQATPASVRMPLSLSQGARSETQLGGGFAAGTWPGTHRIRPTLTNTHRAPISG